MNYKKILCVYAFTSMIFLASCSSNAQKNQVSDIETDKTETIETENIELSNIETLNIETTDIKTINLEEVNSEPIEMESLAQSEEAEPASIHLVMVGDMLMHERVMESGLQEDGSYDFEHLFTHVKDRVQEADLALVNQETILGGKELGLTGYPCFNSPYELGTAEVEAGFDVILHGTNHALDKGKKGALNCMDFWEQNYPDIAYLGINQSQEMQDNNIYVYEQDGIRLAILNYTYGTNGISVPNDMPYLVNYMDEEKIIADIKQAEEQADFTVVCPHWGNEYHLGISGEQQYWTKLFLENGVDLVIGTHPHVIEPVEWIEDDEGNKMLVYYSIGNFVNGTSGTGAGVMNRCVGGLADVTIGRKEDGQVEIMEYDAIPLVCHISEGDEYSVWYMKDYTEELAQENHICSQDSAFSLENCQALVDEVWGEMP